MMGPSTLPRMLKTGRGVVCLCLKLRRQKIESIWGAVSAACVITCTCHGYYKLNVKMQSVSDSDDKEMRRLSHLLAVAVGLRCDELLLTANDGKLLSLRADLSWSTV